MSRLVPRFSFFTSHPKTVASPILKTVAYPLITRLQSTLQAASTDVNLEPAPSSPLPSTTATTTAETATTPPSFYSLLRHSNFVKLGNLRRSPKPVVGKIVHVVDDDLYIEFGAKFKAVVSRPRNRGHLYRKGQDVVVALHDLEMTSRFLGAARDTTLLEADATLLGLAPKFDADNQFPSSGGEEQKEGEETAAAEAVNLSDTLTYDLDNIFLDPKRLEGALVEEFTNKDGKIENDESDR